MKRISRTKTLWALASGLALAALSTPALAEAWKFGVMADTQWKTSPDGLNPNTVAVNVISRLNQEFIKQGVKFVVQVGDLTENNTPAEMDVTAAARQPLYAAGIGFYPLRGNHESSSAAAKEFQVVFPQTQTGLNNGTFTVGSNFATLTNWEGLTYSFDVDNARFVLIDQFTSPVAGVPSHSALNSADVSWVGGRLVDPDRPEQAFVFAHKGFITENHRDNLFGSASNANPGGLQDLLLGYLYDNGVRYHMNGHDHMHHRAVVTSLDGHSKVQNITAASDSYKFYIPAALTADQVAREMPIAQEIFTVGYYVFTVDGPKVTVEHYASPNGCDGDCDETNDLIPYIFTRHEVFGHSLNGKEVLVPQGGSYALADDTSKAVARGETGYLSTTAAILGGTNGSTGKDFNGRALTKTVDTGWAPASSDALASDVLTLWGMTDSLATDINPAGTPPHYDYVYFVPDTALTDTYALSMSYHDDRVNGLHLGNGGFRLATKDAAGNWVKAVDRNLGGKKRFVKRAWMPGDELGTYGVDTETNTAWAVINHNGDFAVAQDIE